jgi:hypothetical protein
MFDILTKKINVLEGNWLNDNYYKKLLPIIQDSDIPTVRKETIPITRLYDSSYWGELRSIHRIDIACLDPRSWYLNDDDFRYYLQQVSNIIFPAIIIFENPYTLDKPQYVDLNTFERKLFERTKIAVQIIRSKHNDIKVLSPAITPMTSEYYNRYIDYFMHHRSVFDIYAVHMCNDMQEPTIGQVVSLLNHVLSILQHDVWVTQWAIPSTDEPMLSPKIFGESSWSRLSYASASQRLRYTFSIIESTTKRNCKWFFSGMGQDLYSNKNMPPNLNMWAMDKLPFIPEVMNSQWDFYHFLGMLTYGEEIKKDLLDSFLALAKTANAAKP